MSQCGSRELDGRMLMLCPILKMSRLSSQPGELIYCYFALRKPPHVSSQLQGQWDWGCYTPWRPKKP